MTTSCYAEKVTSRNDSSKSNDLLAESEGGYGAGIISPKQPCAASEHRQWIETWLRRNSLRLCHFADCTTLPEIE